jgi:hypothetical protein
MAMSPRKGGLDPDQLRALRMVAESHFGFTQSVLLAHGLKHEILTEIVDPGLADAGDRADRPLSAGDQGDLADDHRRRAQGARRHVARETVVSRCGERSRSPAVLGAGLRRAPPERISYPRGASRARVQSSPPQNNPPKTQPSIRSTSALFNEMFDE